MTDAETDAKTNPGKVLALHRYIEQRAQFEDGWGWDAIEYEEAWPEILESFGLSAEVTAEEATLLREACRVMAEQSQTAEVVRLAYADGPWG